MIRAVPSMSPSQTAKRSKLPTNDPSGGNHSCVGTSTCRRSCDEDRGDLPADHLMVINMSGRGDKDMGSVAKYLDEHK